MNYRHIFHAGNFADIFKHLVFRMVLGYLQQKDKGLFVLDAFAGPGIYDLGTDQAQRTLEYRQGIGAFMAGAYTHPDLLGFRDFVLNDFGLHLYAGSPVIAARMLRTQDRLSVNELHPEDAETLRKNMRGCGPVSVTVLDAYEAVRAAVPPQERRGVILVDPPFEKKDEFRLLMRQMTEWKKRWETGCYIIWYPIKADSPLDEFYGAARDLGINRTWVAEFLLRDRDMPDGLNGCGLLIFNTPFRIPERVAEWTPELTAALGGKVQQFYL